MYLIVGGEKLNVAACHGSYCIVRSLKEMEPCLAELVIVVDGYEQREQVYLKNGLSLDSPEVEYESLDTWYIPRPIIKPKSPSFANSTSLIFPHSAQPLLQKRSESRWEQQLSCGRSEG